MRNLLVDCALSHLNDIVRLNSAKFNPMIRQSSGAPLGFGGWYIRALHLPNDVIFGECYINDRSRWVGCPNPPDAYVIKCAKGIFRFNDYGRALVFCAIQTIRRKKTPLSVTSGPAFTRLSKS